MCHLRGYSLGTFISLPNTKSVILSVRQIAKYPIHGIFFNFSMMLAEKEILQSIKTNVDDVKVIDVVVLFKNTLKQLYMI